MACAARRLGPVTASILFFSLCCVTLQYSIGPRRAPCGGGDSQALAGWQAGRLGADRDAGCSACGPQLAPLSQQHPKKSPTRSLTCSHTHTPVASPWSLLLPPPHLSLPQFPGHKCSTPQPFDRGSAFPSQLASQRRRGAVAVAVAVAVAGPTPNPHSIWCATHSTSPFVAFTSFLPP